MNFELIEVNSSCPCEAKFLKKCEIKPECIKLILQKILFKDQNFLMGKCFNQQFVEVKYECSKLEDNAKLSKDAAESKQFEKIAKKLLSLAKFYLQ